MILPCFYSLTARELAEMHCSANFNEFPLRNQRQISSLAP